MKSENQTGFNMTAASASMASSASQQPAWLLPRPAEPKMPGNITSSMSYAERLFHYTYGKPHREIHFLEYRTLQRLNIFALQNRLARLKGTFSERQEASETGLADLKNALHDYTNAIRDHACFSTLDAKEVSDASDPRRLDLERAFPEIAKLKGEPFSTRYCTLTVAPNIPSDSIRDRLKQILPRQWTWTESEKHAHADDWIDRQPPKTVSPFIDGLARFIIAFTGGASLVVPMLIMSLPSTNKTKSLVTVSVAVTLFAVTMSIGIRTSNADTLVATATYGGCAHRLCRG